MHRLRALGDRLVAQVPLVVHDRAIDIDRAGAVQRHFQQGCRRVHCRSGCDVGAVADTHRVHDFVLGTIGIGHEQGDLVLATHRVGVPRGHTVTRGPVTEGPCVLHRQTVGAVGIGRGTRVEGRGQARGGRHERRHGWRIGREHDHGGDRLALRAPVVGDRQPHLVRTISSERVRHLGARTGRAVAEVPAPRVHVPVVVGGSCAVERQRARCCAIGGLGLHGHRRQVGPCDRHHPGRFAGGAEVVGDHQCHHVVARQGVGVRGGRATPLVTVPEVPCPRDHCAVGVGGGPAVDADRSATTTSGEPRDGSEVGNDLDRSGRPRRGDGERRGGTAHPGEVHARRQRCRDREVERCRSPGWHRQRSSPAQHLAGVHGFCGQRTTGGPGDVREPGRELDGHLRDGDRRGAVGVGDGDRVAVHRARTGHGLIGDRRRGQWSVPERREHRQVRHGAGLARRERDGPAEAGAVVDVLVTAARTVERLLRRDGSPHIVGAALERRAAHAQRQPLQDPAVGGDARRPTGHRIEATQAGVEVAQLAIAGPVEGDGTRRARGV